MRLPAVPQGAPGSRIDSTIAVDDALMSGEAIAVAHAMAMTADDEGINRPPVIPAMVYVARTRYAG